MARPRGLKVCCDNNQVKDAPPIGTYRGLPAGDGLTCKTAAGGARPLARR